MKYPKGYDHGPGCSRQHPVTFPCDRGTLTPEAITALYQATHSSTVGDFIAAIEALPYPDSEPAGPETWTDGWRAAIEAVVDLARSQ